VGHLPFPLKPLRTEASMHAIIFSSNRLSRMGEALKHPDQAAILARIPVAGRRVPMRGMWQRRSPDPYRMARRTAVHARPLAAAAVLRGRQAASTFADLGVTGTVERARDARRALWYGRVPREPRPQPVAAHLLEGGIHASSKRRRTPGFRIKGGAEIELNARRVWLAIPAAVAAGALGAIAMYYADPQSGRRRRALVRDKVAHYRNLLTRKAPRTAERRGRFFRGRARGLQHDVLPRARGAEADNQTLVARVRSEVLRGHGVKAGEIHVDAYEGTVTLRGQLESADEIRAICRATQRVDGVREVRSYLHLPGTPPPNKAEAYALEDVPDHMARV
jgi:hypothetical protein